MRSESHFVPTSTSFYSRSGCAPSSPPESDIWGTERRLRERLPPGAPICSHRRRSSPPAALDRVTLFPPLTTKKPRSDFLLLPSRTIDEDEDDEDFENNSPFVTLSFRPTRLFFDTDFGLTHTVDPTTVLQVPESTRSWNADPLGDYCDENDTALSPRLFRFGGMSNNSSRCIELDVADADESEFIFRRLGNTDDRECDDDDARQFSRAMTMGRYSQDDDRV